MQHRELDNVVVIDTETGGTDPFEHSLLSIAVVPAGLGTPDGETASAEWFVKEPVLHVTTEALAINKIDLWTLQARGHSPRGVCAALESFLFMQQGMDPKKVILCGHNVAFDVGFLKRLYRLTGLHEYPFNYRTIDTHALMWALGTAGKMPMCSSLAEGLAHFNIEVPEGARHTALGDALATKKLLGRLLALMRPDSATPRQCACGKLIWSGEFTRPADDGSPLRQLCCGKCAVSAPDAGPDRPTEQPYKLPAKITENRTDAMHRLANSLHQGGCDTLTVFAVIQSVNRRQCVPPLLDDEINRIVTGQTQAPGGAVATETQRADLLVAFVTRLVGETNLDVRAAIAARSDLPADLVVQFATDPEEDIRRSVAERMGLPVDLVRKFAADESWDVRETVARRADLPADLVVQLAADSDEDVRSAIAQRADLHDDLVRTLAADAAWRVRDAIATRTGLPDDLVAQLAADPCKDVRDTIAPLVKD